MLKMRHEFEHLRKNNISLWFPPSGFTSLWMTLQFLRLLFKRVKSDICIGVDAKLLYIYIYSLINWIFMYSLINCILISFDKLVQDHPTDKTPLIYLSGKPAGVGLSHIRCSDSCGTSSHRHGCCKVRMKAKIPRTLSTMIYPGVGLGGRD